MPSSFRIKLTSNNLLQYLAWGLLIAMYAPIFFQLYKSRWEYVDYTHAYFILPIALWLAWRKRTKLSQACSLSSSPLGLVALTVGLFLYVFGWRFEYLFISTFSLIPILFGMVSYFYGPRVTRMLTFPILYLLLLVPPPLGVLDAITLPMRYGASQVAYWILRSFYFPIAKDGLMFSIEGQQVFMGAACSGFRSLITMLSLGLAYAYYKEGSLKKKILLITSILPLALIGNLIRILLMCIITYYLGEKIAQGFFHYFSGTVIFVVMIAGLLGVEAFLNRYE